MSAVAKAVTAATLGPFPGFLTGSLAVFISDDIELGPRGVGIAVAVLFVSAAATSVFAGARVQRVGSRWSLTASGVLAGVALLGIAGSGAWWHLAVWLTFAGIGNAIAQPAANLLIAGVISDRRLGIAFGVKQSAIPAATLVAGLAVPVIGGGLGWRWAFVAGAGIAWSFALAAAWSPEARGTATRGAPRPAGPATRLGVLVVLTVGGGLGAASATTLGAFLVATGIEAGLPPGRSGFLVSVASIVGIASRITYGFLLDLEHPRAPRNAFRFVAVLLGLGGVPFLVLSLDSAALFFVAALGGYVIAWGFMGVFHFGVVRENRASAASATGIIMVGTTLGAGLGPLGFGIIVEAFSYSAAWVATAGVSVAAAAFVLLGERWLERTRPGSPARVHDREVR